MNKNNIDENTIVYDPEDIPVPENLPNPNEILDDIINILEYMNLDEMKTLRNTNLELFVQIMEEKFSDFSSNYYSLFRMVIDGGEDLDPLFKMLEIITNINSGNTSFESGEQEVGSYLKKFIPPELLRKIETGELELPPDSNKKNKKKKR